MLLHALISILLVGAPPLVKAAPATADAAAVEAAFQSIQAGTKAKDLALLERLVDERYVMIHGYGPSEPRSAWLDLVRQGRLARQGAEGLERDVRIGLFGDTAIRSWIVRLRRKEQNQDTWIKGTATFVRQNGQWRMVQGQSTLLHEGPIVDIAGLADFTGSYSISGRPGFELKDGGGYLALRWETGAEMPLIPLERDRFVSAYGSTMKFDRDASGAVVGVTRFGTAGRELFRATRSR